MNKKKWIYSFCLVGILGILIYLFLTTLGPSFQYYVTASELLNNLPEYQNKILKVAGIAKNLVRTDTGGLSEHHFDVEESGKIVKVVYKGFVPDTFKEGSDVVVTGTLNADGVFIATEILAKCASKYEAKVKE